MMVLVSAISVKRSSSFQYSDSVAIWVVFEKNSTQVIERMLHAETVPLEVGRLALGLVVPSYNLCTQLISPTCAVHDVFFSFYCI